MYQTTMTTTTVTIRQTTTGAVYTVDGLRFHTLAAATAYVERHMDATPVYDLPDTLATCRRIAALGY